MSYSLAVIPGDGIGKEVIPVGLQVLSSVVDLDVEEFDWGCERYSATGAMMPGNALDLLSRFDAIYLGSIGWPTVPDHISLWGLLLPIRKHFDQYINLRPIKLLPGVRGPLAGRRSDDVDMVFIRENTEGEYSGAGGRVHVGTDSEVAVEVPIFSRSVIKRTVRYAFSLARQRRRNLVSVTKSNASRYAYVLWDEVVGELRSEFADVHVQRMHVDAMAARMVLQPQSIDVAVASNLFGDILTDLGAALQGSLGLAASGNLNPERRYPSMFEPVHGSAPDIAGSGKANPIGAILAGEMLLRHLGETAAANRLRTAVEDVVQHEAFLTNDLGGKATTAEVGAAVCQALKNGGASSDTVAVP